MGTQRMILQRCTPVTTALDFSVLRPTTSAIRGLNMKQKGLRKALPEKRILLARASVDGVSDGASSLPTARLPIGKEEIAAVVAVFYDKNLKDERVRHWFDGVDMRRQMNKMERFLTAAASGRPYRGRDLTEAHMRLVDEGLGDKDFDAIAENLAAALTEFGAPGHLANMLIGAVEKTRNPVLGRPAMSDN